MMKDEPDLVDTAHTAPASEGAISELNAILLGKQRTATSPTNTPPLLSEAGANSTDSGVAVDGGGNADAATTANGDESIPAPSSAIEVR
jgi:hypothetical protein